MKNARTISRAIVTLLLASSFMMMSFAATLHELSHLRRNHSSGCEPEAAHVHGVAAHPEHSLIAAHTVPGAESHFCFFCAHMPSIAPVTVAIHSHPYPLQADLPLVPVLAAPAGERITCSSPRAPPFTV